MENDIIQTAIGLITPILEGSVIVAAEYVKACGRNTITARDTEYAMKYCARNMVGKCIGTMFPELQDDSESDDETIIEVDEDESPFIRYAGPPGNQLVDDIHHAVDTWGEWEPTNMTESMLMGSINSTYSP